MQDKLFVQDFKAGKVQGTSEGFESAVGPERRRESQFSSTGNEEFDRKIRELINEWGVHHSQELIAEMIATALRMGSDEVSVADLKLINRSLKELRAAANAFAPYQGLRKVAIFGSARTMPADPEFKVAEAFAERMRENGFMIITGGGDGIMGAAQRGAGREHSFGLNIRLPFEQRANETIDGDLKLVNFNYFFTRKVNFVKETHAVALFPGGFGTMDEGFECLTLMQTGKARMIPLVLVEREGGAYWKTWVDFLTDHLLRSKLISPEDLNFFRIADGFEDAVKMILHFYKTFHSYRWVGNRLVFRLQAQLTPQALSEINTQFSSLFKDGPLVSSEALAQEDNEPALLGYPRLIGVPDRRNFGQLRLLIDALNDAKTV
jgi:uncharacterized protein (TIGR00730 family)